MKTDFNHELLKGSNCERDSKEEGQVFRVNDNNKNFFKGKIGIVSRNGRKLENQWIISNHEEYSDKSFKFDPSEEEMKVALASRKQTEVFSIKHNTISPELDLDYLKKGSAMKGAYYSAAFLLRTLIAEHWDIDPEELEIGNILQSDQKGGEIRLNDRLPNGAGFSTQIIKILPEILQKVENPTKSQFMKNIYSEDHIKIEEDSCDSSCHQCLKAYRNIHYHGLLDWRLGVSLLKTFISSHYKCGVDGVFSTPELKGWTGKSKRTSRSFL